jgi:hypothetical protein
MTQLSFVKIGLHDDANGTCDTARQVADASPGCEPRDARLGLLAIVASAVLFYGAIGSLIWHFV